jgi:putative addiction module component (TIGR02574 family)
LGVLLALQTTSAPVVASYKQFSAIASEITMTTSLEVLEAEALKLAPADRSHLLERLIASLDADPEVEEAWELEADRREASLESGSVAEVPSHEAMNRLRSKLAR